MQKHCPALSHGSRCHPSRWLPSEQLNIMHGQESHPKGRLCSSLGLHNTAVLVHCLASQPSGIGALENVATLPISHLATEAARVHCRSGPLPLGMLWQHSLCRIPAQHQGAWDWTGPNNSLGESCPRPGQITALLEPSSLRLSLNSTENTGNLHRTGMTALTCKTTEWQRALIPAAEHV